MRLSLRLLFLSCSRLSTMCRSVRLRSTPLSGCQLLTLVLTASHPGYSRFEAELSPGWVPGRQVDNSDQQYASFRNNLPYLFLVVILHPLLRRACDRVLAGADRKGVRSGSNGSTSPYGVQRATADRRLNLRVNFDVCFGFVFLVALHGFSVFKVLLILYVNFLLATRLKREYVPAVTWTFNICILFANELARGYPYEAIANTFFPWTNASTAEDGRVHNWGSVLDSYGGLIPRWEVLFNVTVLRLISFNLDYYWSLGRIGGSPIEVNPFFHPVRVFDPNS